MSTYTVLPKDDENLNVIVTEVATDQVVVIDTATGVTVTDNDTVKLDITPALIPPYGGFPVESVNGRYGNVVLVTDDVQEDASPTNKWFTDARARSAISATGDIAYDSSTGVISFDATGNLVVSVNGESGSVSLDTDDVPEGTAKYYSSTLFNSDLAAKSTNDLTEGGLNLYYTNARVQNIVTNNTEQFIKANSTDTLTNKSGNVSMFTNDAGYLTTQSDSQVLLFSSPNLTISSGNTVDISGISAAFTTTDIAEGNNLYYTNARFDSRLATKSTTDLTEGTNLYYTDARADARIAAADTDDLSEGTSNLYYTNARARNSVSVTNSGGDGSLAYDANSGVFTYNGPTPSEARAHISVTDSGGDGSLTYDASTGVITYTGPNATEVRAHISALDNGGDGSFSYNNSTGVFSYTGPSAAEARAHFSATSSGDGSLTYNSSTGEFAYVGPSTTEVRAHIDKNYIDGLNVVAASVQANSVALGTDTTGNYVATITGTANEITITGSGTETSAVTVGLPNDVTVANDLTVGNDTTITNDLSVGNDVTVTNDITVTNDLTVGGDVGITGDLTVSGTTTTVDTENLLIKDNLFVLNKDQTGSTPTKDSGMIVERGDLDNAAFIWDESADKFTLGTTTADGTQSTISVTKGTLIADIEGDITGTVTSLSNHDTDDLSEGSTNLYYTTTRANTDFDTRLATKSTTNLSEGTNLYYTAARDTAQFNTDLATKDTDDLTEGSNLYYTAARDTAQFNTDLATKSTTNLTEGTNLYYTAARDSAQFDTDLATKDTGDLTEGSNLYYTAARDTAQFDTDLATKDTGDLTEGSNLYYTSARDSAQFDTDLATKSTTNLSEGTNLYFTDARALAATDGEIVKFANMFATEGDLPSATTYHGMFAHVHATGKGYFAHGGNWIKLLDETSSTTTDLTEGTNLYFTDARADARINLQTGANLDLSSKDTDDLSEGTTNLYYTDARSRAAITASGSLSYDNSTGAITYTQGNTDTVAEGSTNEYFTQARARTSISASGDISYDNSTGVISFTAATSPVTSVNGATGAVSLALADLNNVNSATPTDGQVLTWDNTNSYWKPAPTGTGSGSVTSVDSGTGLTGGPITSSGTLNVDVGTTANKIVQLDSSAKLPAVDGSQLTNLPGISTLAWSAITSTPTTINGYGITDGVTLTGTETLSNKTITAPVINEIKYMANSGSGNNFQGLKIVNEYDSTLTPDYSAFNGAFNIQNYTQASSEWINVLQFQTPNRANMFRLNIDNTDFVANDGTVTSRETAAGSFVTGKTFKIKTVGTTDFTQIGAADNNVNTVFVATGAGSGTGTADAWDTGSHFSTFGMKGADDIGFEKASDGFIIGVKYKIFTVGNTDFTAVGSADNNVGTEFVCDASGSSGTGIAIDMRPFKGQKNRFSSYTASQQPNVWPTNLDFEANTISFHNSYVFPTSDGNTGQVLLTDGSGQLYFDYPYENDDVDNHLNTSTALTNQVLSWTGSDYDWVTQSGGGGGSTNIIGNDANRLITGSATANTLNGQSDLTYDGDHLLIEGTASAPDDAVVNIKTDNSLWSKPQLTLEDSSGKAVALLGQNDPNYDLDKLVFMMDPEGNHNHTNALTGDYGFYYSKDWGDLSNGGNVTMRQRIFGAEDHFTTSVFGDYSSNYAYRPYHLNTQKFKLMVSDSSNNISEALRVEDGTIRFFEEYKFPTTDGTANQILRTDGNGTISFDSNGTQDLDNVDNNSALNVAGAVLVFDPDNNGNGWYKPVDFESRVNTDVDAHLNTSTATTNQVLSWDGTDYDWVTNSGGGSSTLSGLTDVDISNIQNNDLLMYNSTAGEWQNTNLGLSVNPTLTGNMDAYATQTYTLTISNHATYDDPAYYVEVYTGTTKVVANSAVTDNLDGTLTFTVPATGTHEIRVKVQDFGDLQSETVTKSLVSYDYTFNYRYFRLLFNATLGNGTLIKEFGLYTDPNQGGTKWPTSAMTSNSAPTPFVASESYHYGTYEAWKAFNNVAGDSWWNLSGTSNTDYLAIDLGSAQPIESFRIQTQSFVQSGCLIQASSTGAWTGEEIDIQQVQLATNSIIDVG